MWPVLFMLKPGSLDNAVQDFSLAYPLWCMSHYAMLYNTASLHVIFWVILFLISLISIYWGCF